MAEIHLLKPALKRRRPAAKPPHEPAPFGRLEEDLKARLVAAEKNIEGLMERVKSDVVTETFSDFQLRLHRKLKDALGELSKAGNGGLAVNEKNENFVSKLMVELVESLSFDFYHDVLERLTKVDREDEYDEFGFDPVLLKKLQPIFNFLYEKYWRVRVTGIENIPAEGPVILVANHSGTLPYDGAMIKTAVLNEHSSRRDVRFLVEDFVYYFPFLGTLMYRIGGVRASPENAERLLNRGHVVVVFPEGVKGIGKRFKDRYRLQRFGRGGFVKLAISTGATIVPVSVVGAEEIHPILYKSTILAKPLGVPYVPVTPTLPLLGPLGLIPLPSKWTIQFGEPISLNGKGAKEAEEPLYVHQMSEIVRQTIQKMVDANLKTRRSVWWG